MSKILFALLLFIWGIFILSWPAFYLSIGYINATDTVRWPSFGGLTGFAVFLSGIPALLAAGFLLGRLR